MYLIFCTSHILLFYIKFLDQFKIPSRGSLSLFLIERGFVRVRQVSAVLRYRSRDQLAGSTILRLSVM